MLTNVGTSRRPSNSLATPPRIKWQCNRYQHRWTVLNPVQVHSITRCWKGGSVEIRTVSLSQLIYSQLCVSASLDEKILMAAARWNLQNPGGGFVIEDTTTHLSPLKTWEEGVITWISFVLDAHIINQRVLHFSKRILPQYASEFMKLLRDPMYLLTEASG